MNAYPFIPLPDATPVPWGWFKGLLILTFVLHLLFMNFMLGGALLAFAGRLRGRPSPGETRSLPVLIALTVNMGVPPLLFVQVLFGHLLYTSSVLMAVYWISVIPVLILAYYASYVFAYRLEKSRTLATVMLGLASVLLLAIGFLFTNNMTMMLQPELWKSYFQSPGGTILNLGDATLWPRYLHFVVAAVAIAALGRSAFLAVKGRRENADYGARIRSGLKVFGYATVLQMLLGFVFWLTLPERISSLFLGGNIAYTAHLGAAILLALGSLHFAFRGRVAPTAVLALLTVVTMVVVRDFVRTAYLDGVFHPGDLPVRPELNPMILFFAVFVVVGFIVTAMLRKAWTAGEEVGS